MDIAHQPSIDIVHPLSIDTVHLPSDNTCVEAEKVEVLRLKVDENGILRDEKDRPHNSTCLLINAEGAKIPDVIDVAQINDFDIANGMIREVWTLSEVFLTKIQETLS